MRHPEAGMTLSETLSNLLPEQNQSLAIDQFGKPACCYKISTDTFYGQLRVVVSDFHYLLTKTTVQFLTEERDWSQGF